MSNSAVLLYLPVFALWLLLIQRERGIGVGVRFLYIVNLSTQMLVGPLVYWLSGYPERVEPAATMSLIGLASFLIGGYIFTPSLNRLRPGLIRERWKRFAAEIDLARHRQVAFRLLAVGVVSQSLLGRSYGVGTLRAVVGQAVFLSYTGSVLLILNGIWSRQKRAVIEGIAATALAGVYGAFATGFVAPAFLIIFLALGLAHLSQADRARAWVPVIVIGVASLIPYNAWISGREALRREVALNRSLSQRVQSFLSGAIWSNPADLFTIKEVEKIRFRIDESRWFTRAIQHTPAVEPFGYGRTFRDAALGLVPRALWPEKPIIAGGKDFVGRYTGFEFLGTVSVGMHPIFEFYVNFGTAGVIVGLFLFGIVCGVLDYEFLLRGASSFLAQVIVLQIDWTLLTSNVMSEFSMSAAATLAVGLTVAGSVRSLRRRGYLISRASELGSLVANAEPEQ